MKNDKLTAESLQGLLWDTIKLLKSKSMKPNEANAIAAQSREICRVSKVQLEFAKWTNSKSKTAHKWLSGK